MDNGIQLINFTDLDEEEKKMVLRWRNHPDVQRWMYTDRDISWEEHIGFIEKLAIQRDRFFFLVRREEEYLGVIDFMGIDRENKSAFFGLYADPDRQGVGNTLMETVIAHAFGTLGLELLKAEALEENKRAIALYRRFGLKETGAKQVNGRPVVCLELKKEKVRNLDV